MDKDKVLLGIRIAVSLGLISFLLLRIDLCSLRDHLIGIIPVFLFLAISTLLIAWVVNTTKWQLLLSTLNVRVPFKALLSLNFVSLFYNLLLPGQVGGEIIKGIKLNQSHHEAHKVFISIVADKVSGLIMLFLMGVFAIMIIERDLYLGFILSLTILIILSVVMLSKALGLTKRAQILPPRFRKTPSLQRYFLPIIESVETYWRKRECLIASLLYSLLFQGLCTLSVYWVSLGLGIDISFIALIWIVAITSLLQAIPVSISGIGVRDGTLVLLLSRYGIASSKALALSLVILGINVLMGLFAGVLDLFKVKKTQG